MKIVEYRAPMFSRRNAIHRILQTMSWRPQNGDAFSVERSGRSYLLFGDGEVEKAAALCVATFGGSWTAIGEFP